MLSNTKKVSNIYSKNLSYGFHLISNTIFQSRVNESLKLKHLCKLRSQNKKTFKHYSQEFNYSNTQNNIIKSHNFSYYNLSLLENSKNYSSNLTYESKQVKIRDKAELPILSALSLIVISLLLSW